MKRGMVTESHVVTYCDTCGDILTDADGESICFDSTNQAVSFLSADRVSGWVYDGDTVRCDICLATQQCQRDGHQFTELECTVCGIFPADHKEY
ncbi:hypothetical protein [Nocardia salmonicida]|uniref:hypothetical protein n=1 Tax=Nocardia salmonicida TaxID=53431 RepID=UPI0033F36A06